MRQIDPYVEQEINLLYQFPYLEKDGSSRNFVDSAFFDSDEAQEYSIFEILEIAETKTYSFDSFDRIVNAFNKAGSKTISEIIEHVIFPVVESFEKIIEVFVV